jgi:hypothetical protein
MFTIKKFALSTAVCGLALFTASAANAQATRTWVSGVGDDVNPCSRTAPCKTFAGAISKTAAGGEINCLDPGGYGAVTIVKSMTINCVYTEGGVLAGGNGIVVNAQPTDTVVLRGLDIFGVNPPTNGVRIVQAGSVTIEDSTIRRFNAANSAGISFAPSNAGARLFVNNVTITENGNGATGGGIVIQPTGAGSAVVSLRDVRIRNNANNAIRIDSTNNSGTRNTVMIDNVEMAGNGHGLAVVGPAGSTPINVVVRGSTIVGNGFGIIANGGVAAVRVSDTAITGNTTGIATANGAGIFSYGDNLLDSNPDNVAPNNGTFTGAVTPKR